MIILSGNVLTRSYILVLILFCSPGHPAGPAVGKVVTVIGRAFIDKKPLFEGTAAPIGATIKTEIDSRVKILMPDRAILDIGASTEFTLNKYRLEKSGERDAAMTLDLGTMRSLVSKKMEGAKSNFFIRTRSSVLAVRGTEFTVEASKKKTLVTVSEGNVAVLDPRTMRELGVVIPGQQMSLTGYGPDTTVAGVPWVPQLQIGTLGKAKTSRINESHTVGDTTFTQSVKIDGSSRVALSGKAVESVTTIIVEASKAPSRVVTDSKAEARPQQLSTRDIPQARGSDVSTGTSTVPGLAEIPGLLSPSGADGGGVAGTGGGGAGSLPGAVIIRVLPTF